MKYFIHRIMLLMLVVLLSGCGGSDSETPGGGGSLNINSSSLVFDAESGGALPAGQNLIASFTEPEVSSVIVGYPVGSEEPSWLDLSIDGSTSPVTINVDVNTTDMNPGVYKATLRIITARSDNSIISLRDVPVSYDLKGTLSASPAVLSFTESLGGTPDTAKIMSISDTGSSNYSWTASISYTTGSDWLKLDGLPTASGITVPVETITVSVDSTGLLPGDYTAAISVSGNSKTINIPVSYKVSAPQVSFVAPYVAISSIGGELIIRGKDFNSITNQSVKFGNNNALNVVIKSDTEIIAQYPPLAAGRYPVYVENITGNQFTRADLVVVDQPAFADVTLNRAGFHTGVVYDPQREMIYIADNTNNEIERYTYNGSSWDIDSLSVASLGGLAITPDGKELLALSDDAIVHINADTFIATATIPAPYSTTPSASSQELKSIAIANDGIAMVMMGSPTTTGSNGGYSYNILTNDFTLLSGTFSEGVASASRDGSRIVIGGTAGSPEQGIHYYAASTGVVNAASLFKNSAFVDVSSTGSHSILQLVSVYDKSFQFIGDLNIIGYSVFSPINSHVYISVNSTGMLHKLDYSLPDGSGGFIESGTGVAIPGAPLGNIQYLDISPEGSKIFIAGSDKLRIQSAP